MTRRVIFGEPAADDEELTAMLGELMSAGNKMPDEPAPQYGEFVAKIGSYLTNPGTG